MVNYVNFSRERRTVHRAVKNAIRPIDRGRHASRTQCHNFKEKFVKITVSKKLKKCPIPNKVKKAIDPPNIPPFNPKRNACD